MSAAGFSITGGNTDGDSDGNLPFKITAASGLVEVNDADDIDRETTASYTLVITVSDGTAAVTENVVITITDINDNTPEFDDDDSDGSTATAAASVAENVAAVGTYDGTDADSGDTLTYTIRTSGENANSVDHDLFSICLLYTSPSPRDQRGSRMPSSA